LGRECLLSTESALLLRTMSLSIREALDVSRVLPNHMHPEEISFDASRFWSVLKEQSRGEYAFPAAIGALEQLLASESCALKLSYVEYLSTSRSALASAALARAAVFDLHYKVRRQAIVALKGRPAAEYAVVLVEALRHPWPVAAQHA